MIERFGICDLVRLNVEVCLEGHKSVSLDRGFKVGTILIITNVYGPDVYGVCHPETGVCFTAHKRKIRKLRPLELLALQAVD